MSSLAFFAASIDDQASVIPQTPSGNIMNQKKHKRTQKKYPKLESFDTNKVNNVLQKLHDQNADDDEDEDQLSSAFSPPPMPISAGVQRTLPTEDASSSGYQTQTPQTTESFRGLQFPLGSRTVGRHPAPSYSTATSTDKLDLDLNDYSNYGDEKTADLYYQKVLSGYDRERPTSSYRGSSSASSMSPDTLLQKINYMITLLEDQRDEKTDHVTEEVILYSFLGIFIIFVADTFVRVGKYVR